MNEGSKVEGTEDEVGLPGNASKTGWYTERESTVENPVGGGGQRDGLSSDSQRELEDP